jgi:DUF4097 and DUF4098 domain-containing protein YvlB
MKRIYLIGLISLLLSTVFAATLCAQTADPNRLTVAFSDPSRPGLLKVNLLQGSITVKAHTNNNVVISTVDRQGRSSNRRQSEAEAQGLRRLENTATGLSVDEENNVMSVSTGSWNRSANLEILVPTRTNLQLKTVNGGPLVVEGVEGDLEVNNDNGPVSLTDVSGSVVAHSLNGTVTASMRRVTPQKAMSFTSLNGKVDVTLPADTKANLKVRSDNGDVWTDFDVTLRNNAAPVVTDNRNRGGRFRIEQDRNILGTINGGGPDFLIQTMNGSIYIRKAK